MEWSAKIATTFHQNCPQFSILKGARLKKTSKKSKKVMMKKRLDYLKVHIMRTTIQTRDHKPHRTQSSRPHNSPAGIRISTATIMWRKPSRKFYLWTRPQKLRVTWKRRSSCWTGRKSESSMTLFWASCFITLLMINLTKIICWLFQSIYIRSRL